jgi:hypothetical protein
MQLELEVIHALRDPFEASDRFLARLPAFKSLAAILQILVDMVEDYVEFMSRNPVQFLVPNQLVKTLGRGQRKFIASGRISLA